MGSKVLGNLLFDSIFRKDRPRIFKKKTKNQESWNVRKQVYNWTRSFCSHVFTNVVKLLLFKRTFGPNSNLFLDLKNPLILVQDFLFGIGEKAQSD
jgi:hypothetical protein